ncbi:hypothetical protein DKG77_06900 [Flagellimonas aquimarina]|uniref:Uncharacterized protein n=2 Tax=Flagellimonas aquimarina TaxID=2201895 RepID=A0A316KW48_9FLAO|nr:hypothetical protein DKG77_06900 [Allomuricauda koreensis]
MDLILYLGTVIDYLLNMKSRLLFFLIFTIGLSSLSYGQLNDYKYIIVPKKFDAYNIQNKYQTSTTIKYLFNQRGYQAVYDDELPEDLRKNRCLGLVVNLEDTSSLFSTKTTLVLRDCRSIEIFRTVEGRSKLKEFRPAYTDALKKSFVSFDTLQYKYVPKEENKEVEEPITVSFKNDVKSLDEEPKKPIVVQEATTENQSFKSMEPVTSPIKKADEVVEPINSDLLYAQPIENGYQLVDSTPKVRLKLMETSVENVFLVSHGDKNGVVFKKDDKWFFEYAENGKKVVKELNVKF